MSAAGAAGPVSDGSLIAAVLRGERDCYQELVRRHQASMFRVACSFVADADAAADVVQDAFVRAYVNLARCRDPERFHVWVLAMVRNRALDYLKEKRRSDLSLSDDAVVRRAETSGALETRPDEYELRTALEAALSRLSQPLREAFVLRHVEQLSVDDTAAVLGTSASAVKMRVMRAREQLQEWLAPDLAWTSADVTPPPRESSGE
ncbi:MAG TPA: sigma-70 family RNA polymerase sigma factor [Longimicrobiales bacterium]|nr:sigma-70 family RNA polymerase sigma factor [Longimicrobiales bacterium]